MNDKLKQAKDQLCMAWDAHQNSKPEVAFERLFNAVDLLHTKLIEVEFMANHANNTASCLANGIRPD